MGQQSPTKNTKESNLQDDDVEKPYQKYYAGKANNVWEGGIIMRAVSKFESYFQAISNCESLNEILTELNFTIIRRKQPDFVRDYLDAVGTSSKIDFLKLVPRAETEVPGYVELFSVLKKSNKIGVVKSKSKVIKDFYIIPFGKNESRFIPALQNYQDQDLFTDLTRPDLILGVVIREQDMVAVSRVSIFVLYLFFNLYIGSISNSLLYFGHNFLKTGALS